MGVEKKKPSILLPDLSLSRERPWPDTPALTLKAPRGSDMFKAREKSASESTQTDNSSLHVKRWLELIFDRHPSYNAILYMSCRMRRAFMKFSHMRSHLSDFSFSMTELFLIGYMCI